MKTASWPGIVLALAAAVLWGTTGTSQHFAGAHLSSFWIGALRLVIAALFFAGLVAVAEGPAAARPRPAGLWRRQLLAGVAHQTRLGQQQLEQLLLERRLLR